MTILNYNKTQKLNLSNEQIFNIIQKIDLTIQDSADNTPLQFILLFKQKGTIKFNRLANSFGW